MLIISKKKDYYDGVVGTMGIDKTLVYDREIIEVEEKNFPSIFQRKGFSWKKSKDSVFLNIGNHTIKNEQYKNYQNCSNFIIGFCGKLYIGWKLYHENRKVYPEILTTTITYDFDLIKTIVDNKGWYGSIEEHYNYIKNYNALQLFRNFKAPIFIYDSDYNRISIGHYYRRDEKLFINPNLSDYQFYKIFDSFQAFQEISMFMGGVLGHGEKEIIEVADKYKIEQHGFDYKWSFRKKSEKNKK
jgi:hypothetical protein